MDPEHGTLRVATDLRGELRHARVHLPDQVAHRLPDVAFVFRTVRLEPLFVVVLRESAQEAQGRGCEGHRLLLFRFRTIRPLRDAEPYAGVKHCMMPNLRFASTLVIAAFAAACSDSATEPASPFQPASIEQNTTG